MTGPAAAGSEALRHWLGRWFGLQLDAPRLELLGEALRKRSSALGVPEARYLDVVAARGGSDEAGRFAELATVGETYFFRNEGQLRAFGEVALPACLGRAGGRPLSILSAGCSTGEEPYTLAMLAREHAPEHPVTIRGVDLNPVSLKKARLGRYGSWALRDVPPAARQRWFRSEAGAWTLVDEILAAVDFSVANLADPQSPAWGQGPCDIVFCRNVIMYFTPETQREVIARIADTLVPGGYLFLGYAETLRGLSDAFDLDQSDGAFYYRKPDSSLVHHVPATRPAPVSRAPRAVAVRAAAAPAVVPRQLPVEARPASGPARAGTALGLFAGERYAEALEALASVPPGADRTTELLRAVLFINGGSPAAACAACQDLLETNGADAAAHLVLGACFEALGDAGAALRHFRSACQFDATFAMPHLRSAILVRRVVGESESAQGFARALDLLADETDERVLLFGGGFSRDALREICATALRGEAGRR